MKMTQPKNSSGCLKRKASCNIDPVEKKRKVEEFACTYENEILFRQLVEERFNVRFMYETPFTFKIQFSTKIGDKIFVSKSSEFWKTMEISFDDFVNFEEVEESELVEVIANIDGKDMQFKNEETGSVSYIKFDKVMKKLVV